jgi:iron complex transport system ATP-binding protein
VSRPPLLQTIGLSIGYPGKRGKPYALHEELNLSLFPGETTCLLGLNGAGNSTLLRTLCGFQPPLRGEIRLMSKPLAAYSQTQRALLVGVTLTGKTNAGGISVYELVALGRHPHTGFFGRLSKRDREVVENSLEATGIAHKANSYVSELSDGEQQKAMIAKTLAQECRIILLDEPTAFLDLTARTDTMILLRKLALEQKKSILLSIHDLDQAIRMGDRLWLLAKGAPILCGSPEDLILKGAFDTFSGKENMRFDPFSGQLHIQTARTPVGLEGEPLTAHWVGNALIRNGCQAVAPDILPCIRCLSKDRIILELEGGEQREAASVEELLAGMKAARLIQP